MTSIPLIYVESDVPEGVTLTQYRCDTARRRASHRRRLRDLFGPRPRFA